MVDRVNDHHKIWGALGAACIDLDANSSTPIGHAQAAFNIHERVIAWCWYIDSTTQGPYVSLDDVTR